MIDSKSLNPFEIRAGLKQFDAWLTHMGLSGLNPFEIRAGLKPILGIPKRRVAGS